MGWAFLLMAAAMVVLLLEAVRVWAIVHETPMVVWAVDHGWASPGQAAWALEIAAASCTGDGADSG